MLDRLLANDLDAFLHFIYGDMQGYMVVAELHGEYMQRYPYYWPVQKEAIIEHIQKSQSHINTYYTPALFSEPIAQKQHFLCSQVSWVELDGGLNFSGHKPSLRVASGGPGREHWYYRMVSPIDSITELERYNKALAYTLGGDKGGWDAVQLLRPINTSNHKYSNKPKVSVVAAYPEEVWPKGELDHGWTDPAEQAGVEKLTEAPLILPQLSEVVMKYAWPEKAMELFQWSSCPPGTRSDSLMAMGFHTAEMGMSGAEILTILLHCDDKWEKFKYRQDRMQRLLDIVRIAKEKHPTAISETQGSNVLEELVQQNIIGGWLDILHANVTFDWLIENMWLQDTNLVLVGRQNVGKTQLSMRFGMNLALGRDKYLGMKINRQMKILFLSLELGIVPVKLLTTKMSTGLSDDERNILQKNFISAPIGESVRLFAQNGQDGLARLLDLVVPDAVIIDSLGKTIASPSNEEQAIAASDYLNKLNKQGVSFWGIHHQRKTGSGESPKSPELDDAYGNQYLTAFARAAYGIYENSNGLRLKQLKNNFAAKPDKVLAIERTAELDFHKTGEIDEAQEEAKEKPVKMFGE